MLPRLDPRPLWTALIEGLRERRHVGDEPEDRVAKLILFGVPVSAFLLGCAFGIELRKADQFLAAAAVFIGALLAVFAQIAGWRERLTARAKRVDGVQIRALDEAVAHILVAVGATVILAAALLVVSNVSNVWVIVPASSLALALSIYLGLTLLVVVNLLWDGYRAANPRVPPTPRPVLDDEQSY